MFIASKQTESAKPGEKFSLELVLNTNKLSKGRYKEAFSLVQEHVGWIPNTEVNLIIKVV